MVTKAANNKPTGLEDQKTRLEKELKANKRSITKLKPAIHPRNYPHRSDQLRLQWHSSRLFQNQKDSRASSPENLLANTQSKCQVLS